MMVEMLYQLSCGMDFSHYPHDTQAGEPNPNKPNPSQTKPNQPNQNQSKQNPLPNQTQIKPNQPKPNLAKPTSNQTQTKPKSNQTNPNQTFTVLQAMKYFAVLCATLFWMQRQREVSEYSWIW